MKAEVLRLLQGYYDRLAAFGLPVVVVSKDAQIFQQVEILERVIAGEFGGCSDASEGEYESISIAWDNVFTALTDSPAWNDDPVNEFWQTPVGGFLLSVRLWLDCDELISLSKAAEILRGKVNDTTLQYVNNLVNKGKLTRYIAHDEPNPQRAGRVLRSAVEALIK